MDVYITISLNPANYTTRSISDSTIIIDFSKDFSAAYFPNIARIIDLCYTITGAIKDIAVIIYSANILQSFTKYITHSILLICKIVKPVYYAPI